MRSPEPLDLETHLRAAFRSMTDDLGEVGHGERFVVAARVGIQRARRGRMAGATLGAAGLGLWLAVAPGGWRPSATSDPSVMSLTPGARGGAVAVATAGGPAVRSMELTFDIEVTPSECLRDPGPVTCPMGEMVRVGLRDVPVTNVVTVSARVVPDGPADELARPVDGDPRLRAEPPHASGIVVVWQRMPGADARWLRFEGTGLDVEELTSVVRHASVQIGPTA